jgi:hypothetical protein
MNDYDFRDQIIALIRKYSDLGITDPVRANLRTLIGQRTPESNHALLHIIEDCQKRHHCGTLQIKALQLAWKSCDPVRQSETSHDAVYALEALLHNNWTDVIPDNS